MFSAILSALGVYFCLSCAMSCIFWVKHDFCNSLEHTAGWKKEELGPARWRGGRPDRGRHAKGRNVLDVAQKQKNDEDTGSKIEKTAQHLDKRKKGLKCVAMKRRRVMLLYKGKRHSRDNVRSTVMCHHNHPVVISTLVLTWGVTQVGTYAWAHTATDNCL